MWLSDRFPGVDAVAYGGGTGRRVRSENPAVLGGGLAGVWAALQSPGWAFVGCGGMDCGAGPAAAMDESLACSAALRLAAPEPVATDCASRRCSRAVWTLTFLAYYIVNI